MHALICILLLISFPFPMPSTKTESPERLQRYSKPAPETWRSSREVPSVTTFGRFAILITLVELDHLDEGAVIDCKLFDRETEPHRPIFDECRMVPGTFQECSDIRWLALRTLEAKSRSERDAHPSYFAAYTPEQLGWVWKNHRAVKEAVEEAKASAAWAREIATSETSC